MNRPDNDTIIEQYLNHYSYSKQSLNMRKISLNYFFKEKIIDKTDYTINDDKKKIYKEMAGFHFTGHIFDIKTNTLIEYFEYLNKLKNVCLTTKKNKWAILISFLNFSLEYYRDFNFIVVIPKKTIMWQKNHKKAESNRLVLASIEEIKNILDYLREENFSYYCLFRLLIETGMRLGEFLSIQINDLNVDKRIVNCRGKTGEKTYYFSERLAKELSLYLNGRSKLQSKLTLLFLTSQLKPFSNRLIQKILERIRSKGKISNWITPHTFRRTLNTLRKRNMKCDNETAKILLGHKSNDVNIDDYTIYDYADKLALFDKYNPYLNISQ